MIFQYLKLYKLCPIIEDDTNGIHAKKRIRRKLVLKWKGKAHLQWDVSKAKREADIELIEAGIK